MQVLQATLLRFKTYKRFEASTGGRSISGSQFTAMFQQYLAQEGLTNKVALNLSDSLVARALMTRTNGKPTLNARPNALKSQWSDGLLRHEIGETGSSLRPRRLVTWPWCLSETFPLAFGFSNGSALYMEKKKKLAYPLYELGLRPLKSCLERSFSRDDL